MKNSLFLVFILIIISGCSQNDTDISIQSNANNNNQTTVQDVKAEAQQNKAEDAFDFTYNDLDDKEIKLSDYRGKWVVVNFWATWCPPCRKEIPDFVKFKSQYGDVAEVIGVDNEDADIEIIRAFAEEYSVNYPIVIADVYNPTEFDKQNTMGLPTTVIFNPQGVEVSKRIGTMHYDDLVEIIKGS